MTENQAPKTVLNNYDDGPIVVLFGGRRGAGKTLLTCYFAYYGYKVQKRPVFHNGCLNFGKRVDIEDLLDLGPELQDSIIVIDELQLYMDSSRAGSTLNYLLSNSLTLLRKLNFSLLATTQRIQNISSRFTWQTDYIIECVTPPTQYKGKIILFELTSTGTVKAPFKKRFRLYQAQRFWNLYQTEAIFDTTKSITITSDMIRENKKEEHRDKVIEILKEAGKYYETLYFSDIENIIKQNGLIVSHTQLGRWLKQILGQPRRTKDGQEYTIKI